MQEQASVRTSEEERSASPTTPTPENPPHPLDPTATDLGGSEAGGGAPRRISEVGATWRGRAREWAVPLDGAACSFGCARAPARGAAVASPSPTVACSGRRRAGLLAVRRLA